MSPQASEVDGMLAYHLSLSTNNGSLGYLPTKIQMLNPRYVVSGVAPITETRNTDKPVLTCRLSSK